MNWITLQGLHFNLDNVTNFCWSNGKLAVNCVEADEVYVLEDPDKVWYHKLCHRVSVPTVEEVQNET